MEETPKVRKTRADKGVPRAQKVREPEPYDERNAPVFVTVQLRGRIVPVEFGCATHTVENGFHVFTYPSRFDRYRTTRREFAISEIVDIEITAAPTVYDMRQPVVATQPEQVMDLRLTTPAKATGPKIHSARANRMASGDLITRLETSNGSIKIGAEELAGALGIGASVNPLGDSVA